MNGIQCDRKKMTRTKMKQSDDDKGTVSARVRQGSKPVLFPLRKILFLSVHPYLMKAWRRYSRLGFQLNSSSPQPFGTCISCGRKC